MNGDDERLPPWRQAPESAGVLTDFDGTLSAIVDHPEAARPLPGARDALGRLADRFPLVGVISGRPVAYLVDRLGPPPGVTLVGLYGLEKWERGEVQVLPEVRRWYRTVAQVATAAAAEAPAGVYVEPKGLTLGIHFRQAPHLQGWVVAWAADQAERTGLVVHHGKMAVELMPPVATDKGAAVTRLAVGLNALCYLGDDLGDLPAFEALGRLAATGVATLAVAVRSDETPSELLSQADEVVEGPAGALAFLEQLAR